MRKSDVLRICAHFGKAIPILFLFLGPNACRYFRQRLSMTSKAGFWLELDSADETQKRVTILPEKLPDEAKTFLRRVFQDNITELDTKMANEILVKSSPKEGLNKTALMLQAEKVRKLDFLFFNRLTSSIYHLGKRHSLISTFFS